MDLSLPPAHPSTASPCQLPEVEASGSSVCKQEEKECRQLELLAETLKCSQCSNTLVETVACSKSHLLCSPCYKALDPKICTTCSEPMDEPRKCDGIDKVVFALSQPSVDAATVERAISCPMCRTISVPRFSCVNVHGICLDCIQFSNSKECPQCHFRIDGTFRDRAMERIISAYVSLVACPYQKNGCWVSTTPSEKPMHMLRCDYFSVTCPFKGCDWVEHTSTFLEHLVSTHRINVVKGGIAHYKLKLLGCDEMGESYVQACIQVVFEQVFLIILRRQKVVQKPKDEPVIQRQLFAYLIGNRRYIKYFKCGFQIRRGYRRMCYEGQILPLNYSIDGATRYNNCFHLPGNVENGFVEDQADPALRLTVAITKRKLSATTTSVASDQSTHK